LMGVKKDCSTEDIKKAWRNIVRTAHPDKGGSEDEFKKFLKAYETLVDPSKREHYDKYGEDPEGEAGPPPSRRRPKAEALTHPLTVTLEDFYKGSTKRLRVSRNILCAECKGNGGEGKASCNGCNGQGIVIHISQMGPMIQRVRAKCGRCSGKGFTIPLSGRCQSCEGNGVVPNVKVIAVTIERGMKNGDKVVFAGEGEQDVDSDPGDVVVILKSTPHEYFQRQGAHLFMKKNLSLGDALTGFEFKVAHLDSRLLVIPGKPGLVTKPNQLRVIRNEGMPHRHNPFKKGHLYIEFDIDFPHSFDGKKLELLRQVFDKHLPSVSSNGAPAPTPAPTPAATAPTAAPAAAPAAAASAAAASAGAASPASLPPPSSSSEKVFRSSSDDEGGKNRGEEEGKNQEDGRGVEEIEEVALEDVEVNVEKALWQQEREQEQERRAADEEEEDGPRTARCATH